MVLRSRKRGTEVSLIRFEFKILTWLYVGVEIHVGLVLQNKNMFDVTPALLQNLFSLVALVLAKMYNLDRINRI